MVATAWFGMYGPAGVPDAARDRLQQAVAEAMKQPALRERLQGLGYEPVGSTPAELAAAQKADLARWAAPIKATGIQLE
jgi:tripartite-type tricarboxylate transporter receptor subunit TctC